MSLASIGAKLLGVGASAAANWQTLAVKALAVLLLAGGIFFGGFYVGEQSIVKPYATATTQAAGQAADAQHKHDQKQHGAAVDASKGGDKKQADGDAKTKPIIRYIHDKPFVTVAPPTLECPAPVLAPDVMDKLNEAGHQ